jgi:hypothetical protein
MGKSWGIFELRQAPGELGNLGDEGSVFTGPINDDLVVWYQSSTPGL